uniref:Cyclotide n=1 Tax=Clitoria ternatea TaxID=43366 RepID=A0A7G5F3E6_CLITE|nr:cyclotide precursor [Clitoria ternatea]
MWVGSLLPLQQTPAVWRPPPQGKIKIKSDVAWRDPYQMAYSAIIFRDHNSGIR